MNDTLKVGNVALTPLCIVGDDINLGVTQFEHAVLACLIARVGESVSRADLTAAVYPASSYPVPTSNVLEVLVGRIRKKLIAAGADVELETIRGRGYRLIAKVAA